ncbi:MAG: alpha-mannosidase, partial [Clostridia bacterium]|nr:alpha-mannosidase [Clostridia bacterium]
MLTEKQIQRMLGKLKRFESTLDSMVFTKVAEINASAYETAERLYEIPDASLFNPVDKGWTWGGPRSFCWFRSEFVVPEELDGKNIFIRPHTQGYESLLWVNGEPFGTFATKIVFT